MISNRIKRWMPLIAVAACAALSGCGRQSALGPEPSMAAVDDIRKGWQNAGGEKATSTAGTPAAKQSDKWSLVVTGRFIYDASAPTPAPVDVTKDVEVCGPHHL